MRLNKVRGMKFIHLSYEHHHNVRTERYRTNQRHMVFRSLRFDVVQIRQEHVESRRGGAPERMPTPRPPFGGRRQVCEYNAYFCARHTQQEEHNQQRSKQERIWISQLSWAWMLIPWTLFQRATHETATRQTARQHALGNIERRCRDLSRAPVFPRRKSYSFAFCGTRRPVELHNRLKTKSSMKAIQRKRNANPSETSF